MCSAPYTIPNPNFGTLKGLGNHRTLQFLKDCTSAFIQVPCGVCPECLSLKQAYFSQRMQLASMDYLLFFGTLTYSNDAIPYFEFKGQRFNYPDPKDFRLMFKRLRVDGSIPRGCKFMLSPEYGGNRHRPHFHFIFLYPKVLLPKHIREDRIPSETKAYISNLEDQFYWLFRNSWKRRIGGSSRVPIYQPLFEYHSKVKGSRTFKNYDFHYIDPEYRDSNGKQKTSSDVTYYITKYCLKFDSYVEKTLQYFYTNCDTLEQFYEIKKMFKPRVGISRFIGTPYNPEREDYRDEPYLYEKYVLQCIENSLREPGVYNFEFINKDSGLRCPLAPYLSKRYVTLDDAISMYVKKTSQDPKDLPDFENIDCSPANLPESKRYLKALQGNVNANEKITKLKKIQESLTIRCHYDYYELE